LLLNWGLEEALIFPPFPFQNDHLSIIFSWDLNISIVIWFIFCARAIIVWRMWSTLLIVLGLTSTFYLIAWNISTLDANMFSSILVAHYFSFWRFFGNLYLTMKPNFPSNALIYYKRMTSSFGLRLSGIYFIRSSKLWSNSFMDSFSFFLTSLNWVNKILPSFPMSLHIFIKSLWKDFQDLILFSWKLLYHDISSPSKDMEKSFMTPSSYSLGTGWSRKKP